jgi:DNA-binding MarR family transcriptional regulator
VNCPTIRYPSPAAAPRTGRGESALPRPDSGTKTQSLPFAAIPHHIAADPRLSPTDLRVLAALLYHARANASCWASDRRLAQRCSTAADRGPASVGTIQRSLKRLEACGHIAREATPETLTGRRIWLAWRAVPLRAGEQTPLRAGEQQRNVIVREEKEKTKSPERSRPEPELVLVAVPSSPADRPPPATVTPSNPVDGSPLPPTGAGAAVPAPVAAPEPRTATLEDPVERGPRSPREAVLGGPTPSPEPVPAPAFPAGLTPVGRFEPRADSPALVAAQKPRPALTRVPRVEPPRSAPVPATSPAKAGPGANITPEQQQRLAALPEAVREQVYLWLMSGDRILMREAQQRLAPPRPRPETPRTLPELLSHIRDDPAFPALAADWLAKTFGDQKSYSGFKARCEEAWRGELPVERLVSAYAQATGPRAKNRGALFMHAVHQKE